MVLNVRTARLGWLAAGIIGMATTAALGADAAGPRYTGYTNALDQFFWSGGPIVWVIQFPLSIVMVSLAIHYALVIRRGTIIPGEIRQQVQGLVEQRQYREALEFTGAEPSMFSYVVHYSLTAAAGGYAAMRKAMDEAVEERTTKMLRRVEYMNMIGAVSPMIGLFGTTYGIILALNELVLARGTPEPAQLAGAISTALVCTFWGLMTAIPALMLFAIFRNRVDGLAADCALAVEDLLGVIQPATSRAAPAAPASKATAPAKAEAGAGRPPVAQRLDEGGA